LWCVFVSFFGFFRGLGCFCLAFYDGEMAAAAAFYPGALVFLFLGEAILFFRGIDRF